MNLVTVGDLSINLERITFIKTKFRERPGKGYNIGDIAYVAVHFGDPMEPSKRPLILKGDAANEFLSRLAEP
jgi:hypothetical protein